MNLQTISDILKAHEQIVYLPRGARKNPLTYGIIKEKYERIAQEIWDALPPFLKPDNMHNETHPAHQQGPKPPTAGRNIMYYHNGNDPEAAVNGAHFFPALVIQSWGTLLVNIRVFTYSEGAPLLRRSVPHKSTAVEGQPYWDWPEIK